MISKIATLLISLQCPWWPSGEDLVLSPQWSQFCFILFLL